MDKNHSYAHPADKGWAKPRKSIRKKKLDPINSTDFYLDSRA